MRLDFSIIAAKVSPSLSHRICEQGLENDHESIDRKWCCLVFTLSKEFARLHRFVDFELWSNSTNLTKEKRLFEQKQNECSIYPTAARCVPWPVCHANFGLSPISSDPMANKRWKQNDLAMKTNVFLLFSQTFGEDVIVSVEEKCLVLVLVQCLIGRPFIDSMLNCC